MQSLQIGPSPASSNDSSASTSTPGICQVVLASPEWSSPFIVLGHTPEQLTVRERWKSAETVRSYVEVPHTHSANDHMLYLYNFEGCNRLLFVR